MRETRYKMEELCKKKKKKKKKRRRKKAVAVGSNNYLNQLQKIKDNPGLSY